MVIGFDNRLVHRWAGARINSTVRINSLRLFSVQCIMCSLLFLWYQGDFSCDYDRSRGSAHIFRCDYHCLSNCHFNSCFFFCAMYYVFTDVHVIWRCFLPCDYVWVRVGASIVGCNNHCLRKFHFIECACFCVMWQVFTDVCVRSRCCTSF